MQALMNMMESKIEESGEINDVLEKLKDCTELVFGENMDKNEENRVGKKVLFNELRKGVFARGNKIILRYIDDSEYDAYEEVLYENAIMKSFFKDAEYMAHVWKYYRGSNSLYVSIYSDDEFCGYCGIDKIDTRTPEVAIELLKKCHGRGIGYDALSTFIREYAKIVEIDYFLSRVDAENIASINLMKKVGGKPFGLSNFILKCEKEKAKLEREYSHLIDDSIRELAQEWGVEPERLLSHALVFKFDV